MTTSTASRRDILHRRIRLIVGVTIGYNLIEAVIAIGAGSVASSAALIGFGLDSTIEVLSAAAVAWQFTRRDPARWEKPTLRVIAVAFFALAIYVTTTSVTALVTAERPEHSTIGILLTAASVVVMPFLSFAERRAGRELLRKVVARTDAPITLFPAERRDAALGGDSSARQDQNQATSIPSGREPIMVRGSCARHAPEHSADHR